MTFTKRATKVMETSRDDWGKYLKNLKRIKPAIGGVSEFERISQRIAGNRAYAARKLALDKAKLAGGLGVKVGTGLGLGLIAGLALLLVI